MLKVRRVSRSVQQSATTSARSLPGFSTLRSPLPSSIQYASVTSASTSHPLYKSSNVVLRNHFVPAKLAKDCSTKRGSPAGAKGSQRAAVNLLSKRLSSRLGASSCTMEAPLPAPPPPPLRPLRHVPLPTLPEHLQKPPKWRAPWRPEYDFGNPKNIPKQQTVITQALESAMRASRVEGLQDDAVKWVRAYEQHVSQSLALDKNKVLYAVRVGRQTGAIYDWDELQASIRDFPKAEYSWFYKSKNGEKAARAWLSGSWKNRNSLVPWSSQPVLDTAIPNVPSQSQIDQSLSTEQDEAMKMNDFALDSAKLPSEATTSLETSSESQEENTALRTLSKVNQIVSRYPKKLRVVLAPFALYEPEDKSNGKVNVWCDGSSNGKVAGWGVYFPSTSNYAKFSESCRLPPGHTAISIAEMVAMGRALTIVPKDVALRIHSDCKDCIESVTKIADEASQRKWSFNDKEVPYYAKTAQWVYDLIASRSTAVELVFVKAHGDSVGNIAADRLAKRCLREDETSFNHLIL